MHELRAAELALPGEGPFLAGLGLFLGGHVAYVAACASKVAPVAWASPAALAPIVVSALAMAWLWKHVGKLRYAVIAYVVTITAMVDGAIAVYAAHPGHGLLLAGALLFYLSDLSVARDRFVHESFVNRAWGLPAYYAGQVLMALSAGIG